MLEGEHLDAIWVCTPPMAHREPTVAALERGVHVYLEKPIARTLDDAEAIVATAAASGAVCAVGYQWHASELLDRMREATARQAIAMMIGRNYGPVPARPWFIQRAHGGGQLLERGSHHIDLQRALAGDVQSVSAVAAHFSGPRRADQGNIEDYVLATLHFAGGAVGSVAVAWTPDDHPELYSMDVIADQATVFSELGPSAFQITGLSQGRQLRGAFEDPLCRSSERFVRAASDGEPEAVFCTPADALQTLRVVCACEQALATGEHVSVGP
jgi:myo-inositol 2-dehydrogenase / D-chiro-inositol 1-dehydrogenase